MRRICVLVIVALGFLVGRAYVQGIQHKEVQDFSGGLVNSLDNSLMQDNQATILVNYDVNDGSLERRNGVSLHYIDDWSGTTMSALIPFYRGTGRAVLTIRKPSALFSDDRDSLYVLTLCDDANAHCTTFAYQGYFPFERQSDYPFNVTYAYMNQGLLIAATQSEPVVFDSARVMPLRPVGMGQPKAVGMPGGGNVSGIFRYKYAYGTGVGFPATDPTSNMSAPSWPVAVNAGKVVLFGLAAVSDSTALDYVYIFREENYNQKWELVDSVRTLQAKDMTYLDNTASTSDADTTDFPWGNNDRNRPPTDIPPPNLRFSQDTCTSDSFGIGLVNDTSFVTNCSTFVGYAISQVDTFGTETMVSAPYWSLISGSDSTSHPLDWRYKTSIWEIPTPLDSGIVKRWLLRTYADVGIFLGDESHDSLRTYDWYRLFSFLPTEDSIVDSLRGTGYKDSLFCVGIDDSFWTKGARLWVLDSVVQYAKGELPESTCAPDSLIPCQSSVIMEHGFRVYALDECTDANTLLFSEFGSFLKWAPTKQINIPSRDGDWLKALLSLGTNRFLGLRQNSTIQISGHSFYQFTIDEVIAGLGIVAPRSLIYSRNRGGFAYYDGYYLFDQSGSVLQPAISEPIQNSVDSADTNIIRSFAKAVGSEIWWSLPIGATRNNHTYIFSFEPTPHWKSYDFGVIDMLQMDIDSTLQDYRTGRWLAILDNDTLYRWNYKDTSFDGGSYDTIVGRYQGKYFFDDGNREKIFYVDIFGEGTGDSLYVILDQDKGKRADTVPIVLDFTDNKVDRATFNLICENAAVGWYDNGVGDYSITGYRIGVTVWDEGRMQ